MQLAALLLSALWWPLELWMATLCSLLLQSQRPPSRSLMLCSSLSLLTGNYHERLWEQDWPLPLISQAGLHRCHTGGLIFMSCGKSFCSLVADCCICHHWIGAQHCQHLHYSSRDGTRSKCHRCWLFDEESPTSHYWKHNCWRFFCRCPQFASVWLAGKGLDLPIIFKWKSQSNTSNIVLKRDSINPFLSNSLNNSSIY